MTQGSDFHLQVVSKLRVVPPFLVKLPDERMRIFMSSAFTCAYNLKHLKCTLIQTSLRSPNVLEVRGCFMLMESISSIS